MGNLNRSRCRTTTEYLRKYPVVLALSCALLLTSTLLISADTSTLEATVSAATGPALTVLEPAPQVEYLLPLPFDPPADRISFHPLESLISKIRLGKVVENRPWVLPMLVKNLNTPMLQARITAYSSRCPDGGGPRTRWGSPVRVGICAADPRYWGPGSIVWVGHPVRQVLIVEDTGGLVKGPHRFDVCTGSDPVAARRIGRRTANYVPLFRVPPRSSWGRKPADWQPPVLTADSVVPR